MEPLLKKSKTEQQEQGPVITLVSSDDQTFQVEIGILSESELMKLMLDQGKTSPFISVPNVTGPTLARVIQYCRKHAECHDEDELKEWDAGFVNVGKRGLYELVMAAKYLDMKNLLELTAQALAIQRRKNFDT